MAQLKAQLEEEMMAHNGSSGYESNVSSLEDEEDDDDSLCESLTTSLCEKMVPICESTQLVPGVYDEERQEVSKEEGYSYVPGCEQAEAGHSPALAEVATKDVSWPWLLMLKMLRSLLQQRVPIFVTTGLGGPSTASGPHSRIKVRQVKN